MKTLLGSLAWVAAVFASLPLAAATFVVDSTTDAVDLLPGDGLCATLAGECTLRAAVQETNALPGADEITLPAGTYVLTLAGPEDQAASGDLDVTDALTITGAGAASTVLDGNDANRLFEVYAAGGLDLSSVTVQHGVREGGPTGGFAGGIQAFGPLTLTNCIVKRNHGSSGGGVGAFGEVTIVATTFRDNFADAFGGGLEIRSGTIRDSTFAANTVGPGLGGRDVGCTGSGAIDIANTTIDDLVTLSYCNPPPNFSCVPGPDIVLANVTAESVTFRNFINSGSVTARNSIIRTNNADLVSQGYNLIEANYASIGGDTTGNQIGVDPLLSPLADHGGPTPTRLILPGSPAHDAANPAAPGSGGVACESTDQRGIARPLGARCDIGAVESECGDGVVQPGEVCDDGNQTNGDGCDVNCTPSACGNGIVAPGEQCDDGNTAAGDCCSPTCQFEDGGPCSDGNPCTGGVCVSGAGCDPCLTCTRTGCVAAPCTVVPATSASLSVRQGATDAHDKLLYRWQDGALAKSDFTDPRLVTPRLCIYDAAGGVLLSALAPDAGCPGGCWTESTYGFRYSDRALDPDGIFSMSLSARERSKVRVKGKGLYLGLGGLPFTTPVRVRVLGQNGGACFGADFATATRSSDTEFRARLP
jgi:cysteine-rich repeat protein